MFYELRIHTNMRILLISLIVFAMFTAAYTVFADNKDDIEYPIEDLGSCTNERECRAYCDGLSHIKECVAFAEAHSLLSAEELAEAKRFARLGVESGPGGCTREVACQTYCEDVSHITECLAFAEQHEVMGKEELVEARKVAQALRQGAQLPGGCKNKIECEAYCEEPSRITECLAFAEAAGFMSAEELQDARRVAPFMARGEMPGGCRSREQCETYCSDSAHTEECVVFFEKAGFVTAEEAEMFRKTGGKGPGDCRGKEECEAFCNDPVHQEACFAFAKEHGLIPEGELEHLKEGIQQFRRGFDNAPPEVRACLESTLGSEALGKLEGGSFLPNPEIGSQMRKCFEQHIPRMIEQQVQEHGGEGAPPEAMDCVKRIVGELQGPPTPEQEQRIRQECFPQRPEQQEGFEGQMHPEGQRPEEFQQQFEQRQGEEFDRQYQEEFQRQYQQQYQQKYQEEFQRQLQQQTPEGFQPPQSFTPPEGNFAPPEGSQPQFSPPPPQSSLQSENFLGAVLQAMRPGLKILFPFLPL